MDFSSRRLRFFDSPGALCAQLGLGLVVLAAGMAMLQLTWFLVGQVARWQWDGAALLLLLAASGFAILGAGVMVMRWFWVRMRNVHLPVLELTRERIIWRDGARCRHFDWVDVTKVEAVAEVESAPAHLLVRIRLPPGKPGEPLRHALARLHVATARHSLEQMAAAAERVRAGDPFALQVFPPARLSSGMRAAFMVAAAALLVYAAFGIATREFHLLVPMQGWSAWLGEGAVGALGLDLLWQVLHHYRRGDERLYEHVSCALRVLAAVAFVGAHAARFYF